MPVPFALSLAGRYTVTDGCVTFEMGRSAIPPVPRSSIFSGGGGRVNGMIERQQDGLLGNERQREAQQKRGLHIRDRIHAPIRRAAELRLSAGSVRQQEFLPRKLRLSTATTTSQGLVTFPCFAR